MAPGREKSRDPETVDIIFHRDVNPETVREKLAGIVGLNPQGFKMGARKVRLTVQARAVRNRCPR